MDSQQTKAAIDDSPNDWWATWSKSVCFHYRALLIGVLAFRAGKKASCTSSRLHLDPHRRDGTGRAADHQAIDPVAGKVKQDFDHTR